MAQVKSHRGGGGAATVTVIPILYLLLACQNVLEGNKCAPWSAEFRVGLFVLRKKGGVKNMSWQHQAEERCGSVNVKLKQA